MRFASIVFPGPGGPDHQDIVTSRARHLECARFGVNCPRILEVDERMLCRTEQHVAIYLQGLNGISGINEIDNVKERTR